MSKVRDKQEITNTINDINIAANTIVGKLQMLPETRAKSIAQTHFDTFMLWLAHAVKESSTLLPDDIVDDVRKKIEAERIDPEPMPEDDPEVCDQYDDTL